MLKQIVTYFDDETEGMTVSKSAYDEALSIANQTNMIVKLGYTTPYYGTKYVYVYPGVKYEDYMKDRVIPV